MYIRLVTFCMLSLLVLNVQGLLFFSMFRTYRRILKLRSGVSANTSALTGWINQKLDHFDAKETRTWKMRYFKKFDYWKPNGPIYIILGGESIAEPGYLTGGLVHDLAKETKGALFMSEHRYYGKSQPIKKRTVESMKFLSTPQALADTAKLIRKIKKNLRYERSKVVLYGASYAGNLAAWMKLVYPSLVDAAIASSAPVLAKRDFYESLEVINNDYKKYGTADCLENIRTMFKRYDTLFQTKEGIKQLKKEENICNKVDLTKPENKAVFFMAKIDPFVTLSADGNVNDIKKHCSKLNWVTNYFQRTDEQYWYRKGDCNEYDFNTMVESFRKNKDEFSWVYQTCTEYGYFFSTTSDNQPFTKNMPVEFSDKVCTALYGPSFDKQRVIDGVRKINRIYGGRSFNVTKVVFVNGELDPWSSLSILEDTSPETSAVYIPKATHCSDLIIDANDPLELKIARTHIKNLIKKWIGVLKSSSVEFNITINICRHC